MTTRYGVEQADSHEKALEQSPFQAGHLARIVGVEAVANSIQSGTWSIFPIVEPLSKEEARVIDMALKEYRENREITKKKIDSLKQYPKLSTAIEALQRIVNSDPGPAYHIAKGALEEIEEMA